MPASIKRLSNSFGDSERWFIEELWNQLRTGRLFRDSFMPVQDLVKNTTAYGHQRHFDYLRPPEISSEPKFISRSDISQGDLGDCWFLAAVISAIKNQKILLQVVPQKQSFSKKKTFSTNRFPYCGMFWFRFWQFGDWYDVVVDDRLPTQSRNLVFLHSNDPDEFWPALLEKAYIKFCGKQNYYSLAGGHADEAMENLTGGFTQLMNLTYSVTDEAFSTMLDAYHYDSLMVLTTDVLDTRISEVNLMPGHSYAVISVHSVDFHFGRERLICLRNTSRLAPQWQGAWSNHSEHWDMVSDEDKKRIHFDKTSCGEFWMSIGDCCRYFMRLEICHLDPQSELSNARAQGCSRKRRKRLLQEKHKWSMNTTSGGDPEHYHTFLRNPQFRFTVDGSDTADGETHGTIIVSLMQKMLEVSAERNPYAIGYVIYKFPFQLGFPLLESPVAQSDACRQMREIFGRHLLLPGSYIIIPFTKEPNEEAEFLLRIYQDYTQ